MSAACRESTAGNPVRLERAVAACLFPGFPGHEPPDWVRRWIADGLGGVVLFAWNVRDPEQVAELTASLRAERGDVIVATDEEGGDVTRLEAAGGSSYPGNLALGAVDDVALTERVAAAMGADLRAAGITLDLAPVADVNSNPDNPVIGVRSFGADGELVGRHVAAFVRGLQGAGVGACAKHFPGHGDTAQDSHLELPAVEAVEPGALLPFRAAIEAGVRAVMTAHIVVRSVGDAPATLSRELLRGLLRDELGFRGLVITDALEMRAISSGIGMEEGAVRALAAGADALCLGHYIDDEDLRRVHAAVLEAVRTGQLAEERVREAARRVAEAAAPLAAGGGPPERGIGLEAARQALLVDGDVRLPGPALVVELRPEPLVAAGPVPVGLGDVLRARMPETEVILLERPSELARDGRPLVLVVRDAHRHEWQRDIVDAALAAGEAIVVETGIPRWRPAAARGYVATHGGGRVNLEAAVDILAP